MGYRSWDTVRGTPSLGNLPQVTPLPGMEGIVHLEMEEKGHQHAIAPWRKAGRRRLEAFTARDMCGCDEAARCQERPSLALCVTASSWGYFWA